VHGDMRCCVEVNADACRGRASRGCFTNICHPAELSIRIPRSGFASTPLVGAVCSNAARTDLCGGRWVTIVPTATDQTVYKKGRGNPKRWMSPSKLVLEKWWKLKKLLQKKV